MSMMEKTIKDGQINYLIDLIKNNYIEGISLEDNKLVITKNGEETSYDILLDINNVNETTAGLMLPEDKIKLDNIPESAEENQNAFAVMKFDDTTIVADTKNDIMNIKAGNNINFSIDEDAGAVVINSLGSTITVDSTLSSTSTNPVQNKVVKTALDKCGSLEVDLNGPTEVGTIPINADTLGGQLPAYYATTQALNAVSNKIYNSLYCISKSSGSTNNITFKVYRNNVSGRLTMFSFGSNNGPAIYGTISINIYRTINSDPNYLSCITKFNETDDYGSITTRTVNVSWDGVTDPINVTLSGFANWADVNIMSILKLE